MEAIFLDSFFWFYKKTKSSESADISVILESIFSHRSDLCWSISALRDCTKYKVQRLLAYSFLPTAYSLLSAFSPKRLYNVQSIKYKDFWHTASCLLLIAF